MIQDDIRTGKKTTYKRDRGRKVHDRRTRTSYLGPMGIGRKFEYSEPFGDRRKTQSPTVTVHVAD